MGWLNCWQKAGFGVLGSPEHAGITMRFARLNSESAATGADSAGRAEETKRNAEAA